MELSVRLVVHPVVVHFPIALLSLNLALTFWYLRRKDPFVERAAYGALVIGWWGALAATLTGTFDLALNWPLRADTVPWINAHAVLGFAVLVIDGQALLRRRRDPQILDGPRTRAYVGLLGLGALTLLAGGYVGGHLVYGLGFGIR